MAIIGLILVVLLGLYLLWFGLGLIQVGLLFQARGGWFGLVILVAGCAVLWVAYSYSPISVHWN